MALYFGVRNRRVMLRQDYSIPAYKSTTMLIAATRISAAIRTITMESLETLLSSETEQRRTYLSTPGIRRGGVSIAL